jgi:hypothetical protein
MEENENIIPSSNQVLSIYSKANVYEMLETLQHVLNSYSSDIMLENINEENIQVIRLKLLAVLTSSIIQENADIGIKIMNRKEKELISAKSNKIGITNRIGERLGLKSNNEIKDTSNYYDFLTGSSN